MVVDDDDNNNQVTCNIQKGQNASGMNGMSGSGDVVSKRSREQESKRAMITGSDHQIRQLQTKTPKQIQVTWIQSPKELEEHVRVATGGVAGARVTGVLALSSPTTSLSTTVAIGFHPRRSKVHPRTRSVQHKADGLRIDSQKNAP